MQMPVLNSGHPSRTSLLPLSSIESTAPPAGCQGPSLQVTYNSCPGTIGLSCFSQITTGDTVITPLIMIYYTRLVVCLFPMTGKPLEGKD